jgi:hypothetical protein
MAGAANANLPTAVSPGRPRDDPPPFEPEEWKGIHGVLTVVDFASMPNLPVEQLFPDNLWEEAAIQQPQQAPPAPPTAGERKRVGRPLGKKDSAPRKKSGEKKEELLQKKLRGEINRPGRPKEKRDSKKRAMAGHGRNYEYGKAYRARKAAEKTQQGHNDDLNTPGVDGLLAFQPLEASI